MRASSIGIGAAVGLLLSVAACGGSDEKSDADIKKELSETLQGDGGGLSAEQADCFAEIIIDEVGADELRDVDLSADEPPEELQEEITAAAGRAVEECELAGSGG